MDGRRVHDGERDRRGWRSWALLREAVLRMNRAWLTLPRPARRAWWSGIGAGFVATELLALALVWAGRRAEAAGLLRWEVGALRRLEVEGPLSFNAALWLEGLANGFVLWAVVLLAAGVAAWRRLALRAVTLLTGYTLMYLCILTGWLSWNRARPTLIAAGIASPGDPFRSYPSGHIMQAVVAYGLLFAFWCSATSSRSERATAAALYTVLLVTTGVSRLRLGAHWPSDVIAGLLLGLAWLAALLITLRVAEARSSGNSVGDRAHLRGEGRADGSAGAFPG